MSIFIVYSSYFCVNRSEVHLKMFQTFQLKTRNLPKHNWRRNHPHWQMLLKTCRAWFVQVRDFEFWFVFTYSASWNMRKSLPLDCSQVILLNPGVLDVSFTTLLSVGKFIKCLKIVHFEDSQCHSQYYCIFIVPLQRGRATPMWKGGWDTSFGVLKFYSKISRVLYDAREISIFFIACQVVSYYLLSTHLIFPSSIPAFVPFIIFEYGSLVQVCWNIGHWHSHNCSWLPWPWDDKYSLLSENHWQFLSLTLKMFEVEHTGE